jgi:hypothetical protein
LPKWRREKSDWYRKLMILPLLYLEDQIRQL